MASKEDIIRLLRADMRDEHGALILYLQHAYMMGEGEEAAEIEANARDEMRHFSWLARAITQLGGEPTLDRTEMELGGDAIRQWMGRDVKAEQDAIAQYEEHRKAIDDPKIGAVIDRIITDERAHLGVFESLAAKFPEDQTVATSSAGMSGEVASVLDYATRHEYTVVLQYLFHSFMTPDEEASREWETIAINEMQHLGWFGELAAESGMLPLFARHMVHKGGKTTDMLEADLAAEREVAESYARHAARFRADEEQADLVELLERAGENENFHIHMFGLMAERAKAGKTPWQRPALGPTQPGAEDSAAEAEEPPAEAATEPPGQFTVGSLKDEK